jgi:hypothetical protein
VPAAVGVKDFEVAVPLTGLSVSVNSAGPAPLGLLYRLKVTVAGGA